MTALRRVFRCLLPGMLLPILVAAAVLKPMAAVAAVPGIVDAACDGCAMTDDGIFNESVYSLVPWQPIGDNGNYCSYATGCGTMNTTATAQFKVAYNATALW